MKLLVMGGTGLLGQEISRRPGKHHIVAAGSADADIRNAGAVRKLVQNHSPDWVLLAAAISNVDRCEREPELASSVNRDGAVNVAQSVRELGARLLFVSTDYVFDGQKNFPQEYKTSDPKHPLSVYARTKSEAEDRVREILPDCCIARTSWIFGRARESFPTRMLMLATHQKEIPAVIDKYSVPSYGHDVACILLDLVEANAAGIYHAVNLGGASWYELAEETMRLAGVKDVALKPIHMSDLKWEAQRPRNSVLSAASLKQAGIATRPWREALADFIREIKAVSTKG
jgi:dTDP-4-dehydrorhamnose reductase